MNNYILFLITLFCWSPTWYLIKFQLGYVDPLVSVFYRFLIAAIIIFIYLVIKNKNLKFSINNHYWFLFFGTCLYSINYVFFYLSNTYLISAFPAIVFSTVVIMNILGEKFYFNKKPSLKTLIGAVIGMIGIIIIFNDEIFNFSLAEGAHIGLFLALIGTFCASTGNMIHQRNLNNNFQPIQTIAYAMLYGSLVTLFVAQIRLPSKNFLSCVILLLSVSLVALALGSRMICLLFLKGCLAFLLRLGIWRLFVLRPGLEFAFALFLDCVILGRPLMTLKALMFQMFAIR